MSEDECKGPKIGMRHVQSFLLFFGFMSIYISRMNIGVALVAMTNANTTNPDFVEFNWTQKEISYILSSFYWGCFITQFPGGNICKYFGVKKSLGWATFISAILCAITPRCVMWKGWPAFCVIRSLQGLSQGLIYPSVVQHLANWSPLQERNRLGAFSFTGVECGVVLALSLSGIIAKGPMGWPGISYVSAGLCFTWCLLWLILGANSVRESRFISQAERLYIESSMANVSNTQKSKIPTPWRAILTSVPFLSLVVARCSQHYGVSTLQTQTPAYLHGVLKMQIKSNALYSALPFLACWCTSYLYIFMGDVLRSKGILKLTALRRTFSIMASWIPAMALVALGFMNEQRRTWALVIMTLGVAANSGKIMGICLNNIDLSPNHAGVLMSLTTTPASLMPLISPLVVGVVVSDRTSPHQWQIAFGIAAAIFFLGNLVYISLGTTETQPWNDEYYLTKDCPESKTRENLLESTPKAAIVRA
ncbi:putative inorganic phosphate cotransporter [Stomoxys calcitrans]|uniref:putative inorganic phosphate cotransporter n=1 Tax=Stomoxys calcitrans TaxID=35570 RepID=UPI0027E2A3DE|nr:putative inorganic phosphate cotransporter [Stomoxys calcitrans]